MKLSNLKRKLLSQPERLRLDFKGDGEACTGGAPTAAHLEMRPALPMVSREKQHRGTKRGQPLLDLQALSASKTRGKEKPSKSKGEQTGRRNGDFHMSLVGRCSR